MYTIILQRSREAPKFINQFSNTYIKITMPSRLRAPHGARRGECGFPFPDPPRGRPVGGGGTPRSWGYGGISPHLPDSPAQKKALCLFNNAAFPEQHKIVLTGKRTMDEIVEFFSREVQLGPHLCQEICWIFLKAVAQECMNPGDFPVLCEIKQFMMGFLYPESFFEQCGLDVPGFAGLHRLTPAGTREARLLRSRRASGVRFAGSSST